MTESTTQRPDFFISYNRADRTWAEWIAWQLEDASYTTKIQAWDFGAGSNFVIKMQEATAECERTIAVLSSSYLASSFTAPEWAAAFARDPTGKQRKLVPVRVASCQPEGLLGPIVYIDLVDLDESSARQALLDGVSMERPKRQVGFPGRTATASLPAVDKPAFPGMVPPIWNVPARNLLFTGRNDVIEQLHMQLVQSGRVALSGMGGVGKTQTAIEYAHRYKGKYQAILWAKADTRDMLVSGFAVIARLLVLPEQTEPDQSVIIAAVRRWLEGKPGWLLILDNADDLTMARDFFPSGDGGHILLTMRPSATGGLARQVEIRKMGQEEGAFFLLRRANRLGGDGSFAFASKEDRKAALAISEKLDGLPLALDQAGAFIEETPSTPTEYLAFYEAEGKELRARRGSLGEPDHVSVTITFSLAFKKVEDANPASADLLRLCAFLAPDAIPEEILTTGAPHLGEHLGPAAASHLALVKAIGEAGRFSLLRREPDSQTLTIHRLVQDVLKDEMDEEMQRLWAERAVRAVNGALPPIEFSNWPACNRLLPHAQACAKLIEQLDMVFVEAGKLLNQVGEYLFDRAQYTTAKPLFQQALAIREKVLGPEHPDVAESLSNLANLYNAQERYTDAEALHQRAMEIKLKTLGEDHPEYARGLNNLAGVYNAQGEYAKAEPLFKRALVIWEKVLGFEHPDVAISLSNLANLYYMQGRYADAEPLHQRALTIREKVLGREHPHVAQSLNNLAALYDAQGRYTDAKPLYQRALAILEKVFWPGHPELATIMENYATVLLEIDPEDQESEAAVMKALALVIRHKHAEENPPSKN